MLTELRNRGIADALIVCCDGLKDLPDAIRVTWPHATVQTCVVHLVRNSLRYASKKHWQTIARQLRGIHTAPTAQAAEEAFAEFSEERKPLYPAMIKSWEQAWQEFRAVPRVPRRAAPDRVHDEFSRESQRLLPPRGPSPGSLPERAGRDEGALPRRQHQKTELPGPDRQDRRLEADPERSHHPLR
jgi:hypothetical protein